MTDPKQAVVATPQRRSILMEVATRYGMEPAALEQTLRATVVPGGCTKEQFAAFLLVANEHDLNPLTREIYAFPAKGGGIVPIVGVDGWVKLMNRHPQHDGIMFKEDREAGKLVSVTAIIHRKDRTQPTSVTEYLSECQRNTDPWKQFPVRMLRHKAMIQCARVAFGFAGIMDEDEFERSGMIDVTPPPAPTREQFREPPEPAPVVITEADEREADRMTERYAETGDTAPEPEPEETLPDWPEPTNYNTVREAAAKIHDPVALAEWAQRHEGKIAALAKIPQANVRGAISDRRAELEHEAQK